MQPFNPTDCSNYQNQHRYGLACALRTRVCGLQCRLLPYGYLLGTKDSHDHLPGNDPEPSGSGSSPLSRLTELLLHVLDNIVAELGTANLGSPFHLTGEVISDPLGSDRTVQAFEDEVSHLCPTHIAEHHFAAENHTPRVNLVLVCIFGGRPVRGFKDGVAGNIVDIASGSDADTTHLSSQSIA